MQQAIQAGSEMSMDRSDVHINLLRRTAHQTQAPGMRATVAGEQIRAVLSVLDEAQARVKELESGAPVVAPVDQDTACVDILAALNDVLTNHPAIWGQPIDVVLTAWCTLQETPMPVEWKRLIAAVVG